MRLATVFWKEVQFALNDAEDEYTLTLLKCTSPYDLESCQWQQVVTTAEDMQNGATLPDLVTAPDEFWPHVET